MDYTFALNTGIPVKDGIKNQSESPLLENMSFRLLQLISFTL